MPFTPYHFGPGAAFKAVIPRYFSFTVFCFAQVLTDLETAYYMLRDLYPWHRFFHTYLGATLVGAFSLVVGRPLCQLALRWWVALPAVPFRQWFPRGTAIPYGSAAVGAFVGTYSHVLLDSIMHSDVEPLSPFSASNCAYGLLSWFGLHALCVLLGLAGAGGIAWRESRHRARCDN